MQIESGNSGYKAEVNSSNQLQTRAVQVSALHNASLNSEAYSWNAVTEDLAAAGTALAVRNDSDSKYLVIEKIYIRTNVTNAIDIHLITSTYTSAGTAVTGVCLNKAKPTVADATAHANETG
ncbi:MAG: hypothetical protein ACYSWP_20960, partial [Planctomycetota bacterium]